MTEFPSLTANHDYIYFNSLRRIRGLRQRLYLLWGDGDRDAGILLA